MKCTVTDRVGYPVTSREYTEEGFLKVPGRVARVGVQQYLAKELGLDGDPNRVIRVYRPADEVFAPESLRTYDAADVTNDHPAELVNSKTFKKVSVGLVRGEGRRDGDFVVADLVVKDQSTIDDINGGKCELSAGYTAIYVPFSGKTDDGQEYDYIQREIRINHVAVVDRARAGANARVFDHTPEKTMTHKVTLDSGRSVEVQDEATAVLLSDAFERLSTKVADAEARGERAQATADAMKEKLEEANKAASPEAIAARVAEVAKVQTQARIVAGDGFTCDSLDVVEIKRAALAEVRGKVDWPSKSATYVEAAFDAEMEEREEEEEEEEEEEREEKTRMDKRAKDRKAKDKKATDSASDLMRQLAQLAQDGANLGKLVNDSAPELTPFQKHKQSLSAAYKGANSNKGE